ncbi:GumC family protein [Candidatus Cloacimonadota bacterium]
MNNYQMDTQDEQEIKLSDYLNIILRYKWIIISVFILVMIAAYVHINNSPRIYRSTSSVLIEDRASNSLIFNPLSNKATSLNNNIHILKSRPVLEIAYNILSQNADFNEFPISESENGLDYLNKKLEVDTERETDILMISFESTDPREAKEAADALAYGLLQQDTEYARKEFRASREFLAEQLDEKDRKLRASEEDLRNYKLEHGVSMLSEETQELIRQSSELGAMLSAAETELEVANDHLNFLKSELGNQDELLSDVNSILSSPLLEQYKNEIVENQTTYVKLLTKSEYSPDHPEMVSLNNAIENAKVKLNEEIQNVIAVKEGSSDPLIYRSELIEKISEAQIDQNLKYTKAVSLRRAVDDYNIRMSILPDTEVELARLERNNTLNEKIYSMLVSKYEDAHIAEKSKIGNIRIIEEAVISSAPIKPNVKMNILVAVVLGLGLGIGLALLINSLDTKIRTFDDVRIHVNLKILGTIPYIKLQEDDLENLEKSLKESNASDQLKHLKEQIEKRMITEYSPKSSVSEAFRMLRTNIIAHKKANESLSILITSSGPREGKSTIQANLAIALAQMEARVVLVDLDLRRPMVHNIFYKNKENGISDFIYNKNTDLTSIIKSTYTKNLDIITSGYIPPNPSELLGSSRMDEALEILKQKYDYILLDSPPVIAVTDTMVLAKKVDILTLVVKTSKVDKAVIKRAKELLGNIDIKITGAIINGVHPKKYYSAYEYNYYYYYYYGKEKRKK